MILFAKTVRVKCPNYLKTKSDKTTKYNKRLRNGQLFFLLAGTLMQVAVPYLIDCLQFWISVVLLPLCGEGLFLEAQHHSFIRYQTIQRTLDLMTSTGILEIAN